MQLGLILMSFTANSQGLVVRNPAGIEDSAQLFGIFALLQPL